MPSQFHMNRILNKYHLHLCLIKLFLHELHYIVNQIVHHLNQLVLIHLNSFTLFILVLFRPPRRRFINVNIFLSATLNALSIDQQRHSLRFYITFIDHLNNRSRIFNNPKALATQIVFDSTTVRLVLTLN